MPTRLGWYFVGMSVLLVSAGYFYFVNSFMLLGSLTFSLVLLNGLMVWLNIRRIEFKRQLPREVHAGEGVEISLMVHNAGFAQPRFALVVEDTYLPDLYKEEPALLVMALSPGYVQRVNYTGVFGRRGPHRLRECLVSSAFPFGLAHMTRSMGFRSEILVYPRPVRLSRDFEQRLMRSARFFGESSVSSRGEEEVFGVREYRPGQNVARIHWRTTARTGKPMILEMEGRHDASFVLILDTSPVGDPATLRQRLESAIGLCAGITYFLTRQAVLFRFAWYGQRLHVSNPGRGDRHYHAVMERLARAGFSERGFSEWVDEIGAGGSREVPVVVTLGPREHAEARLRYGAEAIIVSASDADFRSHISFDLMGRRSVDREELTAVPAREGDA